VVENDLHLINAHKNHHLPSFVAFVDLVKAYDTANHDLHLRIQKKYGTPPKFVASMRTMYTDLVVVLKTEKEIQEILQSVGVRQGDNMAPVLFLFLMSAAAEALEAKWRETGIAVLKVAHSRDNDLESGCVRRHTPRITPRDSLRYVTANIGWYVVPILHDQPSCNRSGGAHQKVPLKVVFLTYSCT